MGGIYCIQINDKYYIGSAKDLERREREHLRTLESNKHFNKYLQRAYNKYGLDKLKFIILENILDDKDLLDREQWWLENSGFDLFNLNPNAYSNLGFKHSSETKEKMRVAKLGKQTSSLHKEQVSLSRQKAVIQLDKHNNVLNIFSSLAIAGQVVGANPSHISKVCNGKAQTAGGYKWKYNI